MCACSTRHRGARELKASAEILRVISGSIADTKPVFGRDRRAAGWLFEGHYVERPGRRRRSGTSCRIPRRQRRNSKKLFRFPLATNRLPPGDRVARGGALPGYRSRGRFVYLRRSAEKIIRDRSSLTDLWEERGVGGIFVGRIPPGRSRRRNRPPQNVCRPGGHRDPERPPVREITRRASSSRSEPSQVGFLANMSHELARRSMRSLASRAS